MYAVATSGDTRARMPSHSRARTAALDVRAPRTPADCCVCLSNFRQTTANAANYTALRTTVRHPLCVRSIRIRFIISG